MESVLSVYVCVLNTSMGILHDQLANPDRHDWPSCARQDLHVQEAHTLSQLDWSSN